MQALLVLFGAAFTAAVCIANGRLLLRRIAPGWVHEEEMPLAFIAGAAVLSAEVFVLCLLHLAYPGVFLALGAGVIGVAVHSGSHRALPGRFEPLSRVTRWIFTAGFSVFTVLYFFNAMAPECSPDGSSYHLSLVARYLREHSLVALPYNMYAQLSQGVEMLFTFAFAFGRHSAAALVHYCFLLALVFLILAYGRRIGRPLAGVAAALFVYSSPIVGLDGTIAYVDVAVAAILFAVFYALQVWDESRSGGLLVIVGLLAGFAFAAKYTAFLAVPYAVGFVLWRARTLRPAIVVMLCSLILIAPWVLKDLIVTGNPFSPMMNSWFPNSFVHISFERAWSQMLRTYDTTSAWQIPWELAVKGERLQGVVGPVLLLLPVTLLSLRTAAGRRLLAPAILYTVPYFANIGARFLIPALPFWCLAIALALSAWPRLLGATSVLACIVCWPGIVRLYAGKYIWALEAKFPVPAALRIESEDHWLGRKYPQYVVTRLLEDKTPPGARILTFAGQTEAYTSRDLAVTYQSARGEVLADIFNSGFLKDYQAQLKQTFRFPAQQVRRLRVVQQSNAANPAQEWIVNEFRIYANGREVPRSPEWRISARQNPWDVQLAFDGNPITRWRAWQPVSAGAYIEVDLFSKRDVDEVVLETSAAEAGLPIEVEVANEDGRWRTVATRPVETPLEAIGFAGRAAVAEIKARGFDYLLISDQQRGAREATDYPQAWGLAEVGRVNNWILYRIDVQGPELQATP